MPEEQLESAFEHQEAEDEALVAPAVAMHYPLAVDRRQISLQAKRGVGLNHVLESAADADVVLADASLFLQGDLSPVDCQRVLHCHCRRDKRVILGLLVLERRLKLLLGHLGLLREGVRRQIAASVLESAYIYIFNLNIFHILVFSHSFFVDFEAPPELRTRRRGFQKMRVVLRHNEKWTKPTAHAHSEQQSVSAENPRRVFVFLNFHHDGVLEILLDSTILNVAFEAPPG